MKERLKEFLFALIYPLSAIIIFMVCGLVAMGFIYLSKILQLI